MSAEQLAARLKRLRLRAKLSQEELAARASVSTRTVSDIERGVQTRPRQITLDILSDALGLDDLERRELRAAVSSSGITPIPPVDISLVGRDRVIGEMYSAFAQGSREFITITGAPGVGKTVLARCLATMLAPVFPGGVAFVPLEEIREADDLLAMIARSLGVPEPDRGPKLREALVDRMKMAPMLLVLDNIEHVARGGPVIAELAHSVPALSILATGTRAFNLSIERVVLLPPLAIEDASALFVERASAMLGDYAPDAADRDAIARICAVLEGLPLAIELASMRLHSLTPAQIADRIWDLLADGPQDFPMRHQALEAAIAWSSSLLHENEALAFTRFAIFSGGASLEAAEQIGPMSASEIDALVRQNLLIAEGNGSKRRLRMLAPIREFAAGRLRESGDEEIGERHALYFTELAETMTRRRSRETLRPTLERFDAERQNFARAWKWICEHERWDLGTRMVCSLGIMFEVRHAFDESKQWFTTIVERSRGALDAATRWSLLWRAISPFQSMHEVQPAERLAQEALEIAQTLDAGRVAASLERLAALRLDAGDVRGSLELYNQALEHVDEIEPFFPPLAFYNNIALGYSIAGDYDEALRYYAIALEKAQAAGNDLVRTTVLQNISEVYWETGNSAAAEHSLAQATALADELDYWEGAAVSQLDWARIAISNGDLETARKSLAHALEYFASTAQPLQIADTLRETAYYLTRTGSMRQAVMIGTLLAQRYPSQRVLPKNRALCESAECEALAALPAGEAEECRALGASLTLDGALEMLVTKIPPGM